MKIEFCKEWVTAEGKFYYFTKANGEKIISSGSYDRSTAEERYHRFVHEATHPDEIVKEEVLLAIDIPEHKDGFADNSSSVTDDEKRRHSKWMSIEESKLTDPHS